MAIPDQSIPESVTHVDGRQAVAKLFEKNRITLAILVLSQRRQTTQIVEQYRFDFRFGSLDKSVQIFEEERTDALELTKEFFGHRNSARKPLSSDRGGSAVLLSKFG